MVHHFKLYETEDDGRKRIRGRDHAMEWSWEHGPPRAIQTHEPHETRPDLRVIVTYERREEWLDGRPHRTYYVRQPAG